MRSRVAYVVLVHRNAAQVGRLLRRLATDTSLVLVHADRRAGEAFELELRDRCADLGPTRFLRRRRCYWGGFGMVAATLEALALLVEEGAEVDHVVLLSGQDYPLRAAVAIEEALGDARGTTFMTATRLPGIWPDGGLPRVRRWHLVSPLVLHVPVPWIRRVPGGRAPYGGGAWICLARPAVELVVETVRREPALVRFFEHALHPDELFFQTILMNSPLASTVVHDHLRFIDWSVSPGPAVLGESDLPRMLASGRLFARKFDAEVDARVLDRLDERALEAARAR